MTAETPRTEQQHWAEAVAECITDEQEALRIVGFYEDGEWQPEMLAIGRENLALKRDLTAAREQSEARKTALQFAERAIEDAIYTEDGLDGEAGERVLHVIQEAMERGTFDQTKIGELGPSTLQQLADMESERDAARARVAELEAGLLALANAADDVGVTHLDKEDLTDEGQAMLYATAAARALLSPSPETTK